MVSHHLMSCCNSLTAPFNSGSFLTLDGLGSGMWDFALVLFDENNSIGYFDKKIFRFFRGKSDQHEFFYNSSIKSRVSMIVKA